MEEGEFPPQAAEPKHDEPHGEAEMGGMDIAWSSWTADWIKGASFMASSWATAVCLGENHFCSCKISIPFCKSCCASKQYFYIDWAEAAAFVHFPLVFFYSV